MTTIDKVAWIQLEDGRIHSTRSRGKDVYYLPAANASLEKATCRPSSGRSARNSPPPSCRRSSGL